MTTQPVFDMIAFLVRSKFPDHQLLRHPQYAPELPVEERRAAVAEPEAYEAELSAKPAEELAHSTTQSVDVRRRKRGESDEPERKPRNTVDFSTAPAPT